MTRKISIYGATGSIGQSAFSLLDQIDEEFEIDVISGHANSALLEKLAAKYRPNLVVLSSEYADASIELPSGTEFARGKNAFIEAASREVDWALNAVIGAAGLPVSMAIAGHANTLALANKESLVTGGALLKAACLEGETALVPVDSEHSAIFQCLLGQDWEALEKVILTASGGAFRNATLDEMRQAKLQDALEHPSWDMGARITIDSASMFNKALEMIEAKELFDLDPSQIEVLIHPQSIVHSLVEFSDQGQIAQLGLPDMQHAIGFALGYPKRLKTTQARLDLAQIGMLHFEAPDLERFPALRMAREVMMAGGAHAIALNAAKEIALDRFMADEIGFLDMARIVENVLARGDWNFEVERLSEVESADQLARDMAKREQITWL